jgi:hypothetical protein
MSTPVNDGPSQLDALQPDGNFRDDPPGLDALTGPERYERLPELREARRVGPRHPSHPFHARWRKDHGLDQADDKPTEP